MMEIDVDPLEGSSYGLGVTVKAEIKEEEDEDHYNTITCVELLEPLTKRTRSTNWSEEEKMILKNLVLKRAAVIENKETTTIANNAKKQAWEEVLSCFNVLSRSKRDMHQLLTQWRNMKNRAKKSVSNHRSARNTSGGDPPTPTPPHEDRELVEVPPKESIVDCKTYDSDSGHISQTEESLPAPETPVPVQPIKPQPTRTSTTLTLPEISQSTQESAAPSSRSKSPICTRLRRSAALQKNKKKRKMALLELAQCVQTNQEPIEFNSTDAMMDPKTGLMICLHCLEDFDSSLLSDHMINAHNYRRVLFKCHICQSTFQERKLLVIHRQECQPEPKVRKRKTFQQIMREVETKYLEEDQEDLLEPVACPICLLELPKYCLKEHLMNEHRKPDVILTCGRCNRNFKSKLTLREHVKLVHEAIEDSEECELCGQKFRSLKYLSNHKRNVHPSGNKIHKCPVCGKVFKSRLCLHQHTKYVHPPESASVECPHCPNKMFKSRINLTQHLKVSHGWKRK